MLVAIVAETVLPLPDPRNVKIHQEVVRLRIAVLVKSLIMFYEKSLLVGRIALWAYVLLERSISGRKNDR